MQSAGCWVRVPGTASGLLGILGVGAKDFTELRAWQLARRLKVEVDRAILAKPAARAQRRFHEQLSDAVCSAPRNLAEGFRRCYPPRVRTLLADCQSESQGNPESHPRREGPVHHRRSRVRPPWQLSNEAVASTTALLKYLTRRKGSLAERHTRTSTQHPAQPARTLHRTRTHSAPAPRTQHRTLHPAPCTLHSSPSITRYIADRPLGGERWRGTVPFARSLPCRGRPAGRRSRGSSA